MLGRDLDATLLPRKGLDEIGDLLDALTKEVQQVEPDDMSDLPLPKPDKLDFNRIEGWERNWLREGWKHTGLVDVYYHCHRDEMAEPLATQALNSRYLTLRSHGLNPNETIAELLVYVTGGAPSGAKLISAYTVLAYFLQRCHIFENSPDEVESGG